MSPLAPTQSRESRLARNLRLVAHDPGLFFKKVGSWLRPMRADYRRVWNRGLRQWMIRYHEDVLFDKVTWMGSTARKMVLDAWVYQQILYEVKPDFIIEIGNAEGGSTKFLANMLDLLGRGEVVAVDIDHSLFQVEHPRIHKITGDSLAPGTLEQIAEIARGGRGLVIHDGDHSREHVLRDLRTYAQFVGVGSYLIVEDTVIDLFRAGDGPPGIARVIDLGRADHRVGALIGDGEHDAPVRVLEHIGPIVIEKPRHHHMGALDQTNLLPGPKPKA